VHLNGQKEMKPTFTTAENSRRDSVESVRRSALPKTDFAFRATSFDFSGSGGTGGYPSFRGISDEFFKKEARGLFASEAAIFALIVVTVAVPLFEVARDLVTRVL
jgi:hypothetical protein